MHILLQSSYPQGHFVFGPKKTLAVSNTTPFMENCIFMCRQSLNKLHENPQKFKSFKKRCDVKNAALSYTVRQKYSHSFPSEMIF